MAPERVFPKICLSKFRVVTDFSCSRGSSPRLQQPLPHEFKPQHGGRGHGAKRLRVGAAIGDLQPQVGLAEKGAGDAPFFAADEQKKRPFEVGCKQGDGSLLSQAGDGEAV